MRKQNWEISHRYNTMHDKWIVKERTDLANYYNPYLKLRYNVTSTTTTLIETSSLKNLEEIVIDGESMLPIEKYTFATIGEHDVWFKFTDEVLSCDDTCYECVRGFSGISTITKIIEIPTNLLQLKAAAFGGDENITNINLCTPNNKLTTISNGAFNGCRGLKEIIFPNSLKFIGSRAFDNCIGLTELIIPNSVETIEGEAFQYCRNIEKLKLSSSLKMIEPNNWTGNKKLKEVIIPEGVKKINGGAFYGCTELKNIIIPSTITEIQVGAFSASGLTEIICRSTTAPIISDTGSPFSDIPSNGTLYVPYGCTEAYAQWMSTEDGYLGAQGWTIQELPKE